MRFLTFLEYTAIVVGAIGMAAGKFFLLPKAFHLGLFLIGAGVALGGLESVIMRRMSFRSSSIGGEAYGGAPSVIWGFMALTIGAAAIASAYLMEEGLWRSTVNYLTRRPGPVLAVGGLLVMGAGALLMFNRRGKPGVWRLLLVRIPKATLGLLLIGAGLAAVGLGALEWFDPRAFNRISGEIWRYWDSAGSTIARFWRSLPGLR